MRAIAPEARITTEQRVAVPPLAVADASILAWVQALARSPEMTTVPFASEAGFFQQAGLAAVVCGPGEPAEAHQADEFVAMQQIDQCVTFLQRLAESPPPMSSLPAEELASAPAVPYTAQ
jgi:acetylornithine deacetylase